MMTALLIAAGAAIAVLLQKFHEGGPLGKVVQAWALYLIIAALVYAVLAVVSGDIDAMRQEAFGLTIFTLIAYRGVRQNLLVLSAGWLGHALWDTFVDVGAIDIAPDWYGQLCLGFNIYAAILLWRLYRQSQSKSDQETA